ncbi:Uncharacterised protein [Shewanella putrefaciens]|uniref:hypothetical protein n=1 Tax=Shewanella putrefaciens TaxID=24 RepID=UPI000E04AC07|nr:hypothetical protein [Shewanella putrefaciens]SUI78782.1 Uncharacterised protein [Shewanella putrefaciens]
MRDLLEEVTFIRQKIESITTVDKCFFSSDFPINACKHASMLLCYHLLKNGYNKALFLVFGVSKMRDGEVGHWWIESEENLIDITADQFNLIEDSALSYKIKKNRQYLPIYCCPVTQAPHRKIFTLIHKERRPWNEDDLCDIYLDELDTLYRSFI